METWPDAAFTPFRCAKGSTWEGGVRVPGLVYWPGMIEAGRQSDGLFDFNDVLPTALGLAGAPTRCRPTATSTASTRRASCWRPTASPTASTTTTG